MHDTNVKKNVFQALVYSQAPQRGESQDVPYVMMVTQ